ncbi:16S rRNA (cytosine(1402)-N(4))-methyltransferase [Candidatus Gracilibacteria bacterium]|nr:MAG: 16S rRNA (cytosine(1402)-N(4))-methyltransferase [Candidatus Gracilibacteria bacterium]PIE85273.1 MAG: 16S rRNA (cytosine(1402)-N(4))-methyltransferase [Candidatus Gracilibacteria bacterium]
MTEEEIGKKHIPVLLNELVDSISISKDKQNIIVDGTLGMGGHALKIIEKMNPLDIFIGFDADLKNLSLAKERLRNVNKKIKKIFINSNFVNLKQELQKRGINKISGIYYDLGISSLHVDEAERGFSFNLDGPLDMRFDKNSGITAAEIVNSYSVDKLYKIFKEYGEEPNSKKIASKIVERRKKEKFKKTKDLANTIGEITSYHKTKSKIFQAIRIEVNNELENIKTSLKDAIELLETGGSIFVISFHSLEDRITKQIFKRESKDCICQDLICSCKHKKKIKILSKKPIIPSKEEIKNNIRSRSAKARFAKKI